MTLSRFLRDFLYIPLGGSRGGRAMTYRNLMMTMVLGGLWHGAAWPFVLWGTFHGVGLDRRARVGRPRSTPAWLRWFVTFHLIVFGWILFRSHEPRPRGHFLVASSARARDLVETPAILAIVVVIGLQLLPERPSSGCRSGSRISSRSSWARPSPCGPVRRRHRLEPGRRTLHLLPFLMTQPDDDSLMNRFDEHGLRRFRARDAIVADRARRAAAGALRGRVGPERRRADGPRPAGTWCWPSASPPGGSRISCRWRMPRTERRPGLPRRRVTRATRSTAAADVAGADTRVPPVTADAFDPARIGANPGPKRRCEAARHGRLDVQPLDAEMAPRSGRPRRTRDPRPASRHRHLQELPGRLGAALRRPGTAAPPRCRRRLRRRERGLSHGRSRWPQSALLRRRLGRGVREPRTPDVRHLPAARPGTGVLDRTSRASLPPARQRISRVVNEAVEVAAQPWRGTGPRH